MTFSEGFSTGNQKMCRDTLLASCPIQQSGAFYDRKKASASTLLWPANHFFHAWAHLPYLPGGLGGGGDILPMACTGRPRQKGVTFSGFRVYERVGKFVISVFKP